MIDRVLKKCGRKFVTLYRRQCSKPSRTKRNAKRQNGYLRGAYKQLRKEEKQKAKEKRKDAHLNAEFQRKARRDKKAFLSEQLKKQRKATQWETLEIYSRKLEIAFHSPLSLSSRGCLRNVQGNISCKDGLNKGQKQYGPNRSKRYLKEVTRIYRRIIQRRSY